MKRILVQRISDGPDVDIDDDVADGASSGLNGGERRVVLAPWVDVALGPFPRPESATQGQLIEGLVQVVRTHGPILASHAYRIYVQAAGGQRVGKRVLHALNKATYAATRKGVLLATRPPGVQGVQAQTLYCPGRRAVVVRELGSRDLVDVPPEETVALAQTLAAQQPSLTEEALCREVLRTHGLMRLTERTRTYLARCLLMMRGEVK